MLSARFVCFILPELEKSKTKKVFPRTNFVEMDDREMEMRKWHKEKIASFIFSCWLNNGSGL